MKKFKKWISCILGMLLIFQCLNISNFNISIKQNAIAHAQETNIKVNFQTHDSEVPEGYIPDYGEIYGNKDGYTYGWNKDNKNDTVSRAVYSEISNDTFCQFGDGDIWEIELESGIYDVMVSVGDAVYGSTNTMKIEGIPYWDNITLEAGEFATETKQLEVADGKLTVEQGFISEYDTKINYMQIIPKNSLGDTKPPSVPQNLRQQGTFHDKTTLIWDSATDDTQVKGYIIYRDNIQIATVTDGVSYMDSGLMPYTKYTYQVATFDTSNNVSEKSEVLQITTATEPGSGTGLKGEYYDNPDLTNMKFERIDEEINFAWKNKSPLTGGNKDEFSIKWTGEIEPRFSEPYKFYIEAHGGVRLWVDGKLRVDRWTEHNMVKDESEAITVEAGKRYDIKIEYRETNGTAKAKLMWSSPSQIKETVPKSQLYPLGIPQNIKLESTMTEILVEWDRVTYADEYDIEVDGEIVNNGSSTIFTHENLVPGTRHTYRVRGRSGIAVGEWSPILTKTTLLGKPEQININGITERSIDLSWDNVHGAQYYDIEVDGIVINNGDKTSYFDTDLSPGTLHSYRVRARSDYVTGDWTSSIAKWTLPDVPRNISTSGSSTSITITWDEVIGSTGYDVEVYGEPIDNGTNTKYTHTGLNPNMQHTYRIRAKNSSGYGKWSGVVAKTTLPHIPTNINTTATDTSIELTWDAVAGATSYDIEIDESLIKEVTTANYMHSGLTPNTSHKYRIRAKNSDGASNWSSYITETTLLAIPINLSATSTDSGITVTWNEVDGATSYDIEVDGVVINNGLSTTYIHTDLQPNAEHSYRVRARNGELTSFWSLEITKITLLGIPTNLQAIATSNEITANWDTVVGASGYDIEVDGEVIDNGLSTTYIHSGLTPNTEHTYRVRARNTAGAGEWSETITKRTSFGIPTNLTAISTNMSITISWSKVAGATRYDVLVDGEVIDNGSSNIYVHDGLEPNTWHIYRVRAKSGDFAGDWSDGIAWATLVGIPTNITAEVTSDKITITWDEVIGATGYDIEVDGVVIDNGTSTTYIHGGLTPNTLHNYRIRAKNENGISDWSSMSDWSTLLPQITAPDIPQNLQATATTTEITITWDEVEGATAYDIEVDGVVIEDITTTSYTHTGLEPNTWHIYRVRAKNEGGLSEWSEELQQNTNPEIAVNVGKDNIFNFVVLAPKKDSVSTRTIVVRYNPDELDVIDLCAVTPQIEDQTGAIEGTNMTVEKYIPGEIAFVVHNADKSVVNSIKFRAKTNNHSKVNYVVE